MACKLKQGRRQTQIPGHMFGGKLRKISTKPRGWGTSLRSERAARKARIWKRSGATGTHERNEAGFFDWKKSAGSPEGPSIRLRRVK